MSETKKIMRLEVSTRIPRRTKGFPRKETVPGKDEEVLEAKTGMRFILMRESKKSRNRNIMRI
jgi:hypothetical protein